MGVFEMRKIFGLFTVCLITLSCCTSTIKMEPVNKEKKSGNNQNTSCSDQCKVMKGKAAYDCNNRCSQ